MTMQQQNVGIQRMGDNTTPIQKMIIAQYIGSALSDNIDDSVGFNEGNKLKPDTDKAALRSDIIDTVTNPNINAFSRYKKLHKLIHEPYKTKLHQPRYGNVDITQNDVIKETARQLDALFDYEADSDKSFVKKANSFLDGHDKKLSDMAAERYRQYVDEPNRQPRWRDAIQQREEAELIRTSVRVGIISGLFTGVMLGMDYNEDTQEVEGFRAGRAIASGIGAGVFAGLIFYKCHCNSYRSAEVNRRLNAQNDNADGLELAELGQAGIER